MSNPIQIGASNRRPKICPVGGCTDQAKPGHLMCLGHWRKVSRKTQKEVWNTFNDRDWDAWKVASEKAIEEANR